IRPPRGGRPTRPVSGGQPPPVPGEGSAWPCTAGRGEGSLLPDRPGAGARGRRFRDEAGPPDVVRTRDRDRPSGPQSGEKEGSLSLPDRSARAGPGETRRPGPSGCARAGSPVTTTGTRRKAPAEAETGVDSGCSAGATGGAGAGGPGSGTSGSLPSFAGAGGGSPGSSRSDV